jgi:hypothetical protein
MRARIVRGADVCAFAVVATKTANTANVTVAMVKLRTFFMTNLQFLSGLH